MDCFLSKSAMQRISEMCGLTNQNIGTQNTQLWAKILDKQTMHQMEDLVDGEFKMSVERFTKNITI